MSNRTPARGLLCSLLVLAFLLVPACGSDDGDDAADRTDPAPSSTAPATGAETEGYCQATLALERDPGPDLDFETASPEDIAAGLKSYATDTLGPLLDDVEAVVPAELEEELATYRTAVEQVAETGDSTPFEDGSLDEVEASAHAYDLATCGWTVADVATTDYAFGGLEDTYPSGPLSLELTNAGDELHELLVLRVKEGVEETGEELVNLPEEEARSKVEIVGGTDLVAPDDDEHLVVDLSPGRYVVACFLPEGATSMEALETAEGQPHAHLGMVHDVTVS